MPRGADGKALRRPESVQVFLVSDDEGQRRFLLLHRVPMPHLALPAFWQGVSGALEQGESFEQAALREVLEETQITVQSLHDAGFSHRYPIRPEWRDGYGAGPSQVEERTFYAHVAAGTLPQLSAEHQSFRWCTFEEAIALLDFGQNRQCLMAVERCLRPE